VHAFGGQAPPESALHGGGELTALRQTLRGLIGRHRTRWTISVRNRSPPSVRHLGQLSLLSLRVGKSSTSLSGWS